jgi:hypothetical protein
MCDGAVLNETWGGGRRGDKRTTASDSCSNTFVWRAGPTHGRSIPPRRAAAQSTKARATVIQFASHVPRLGDKQLGGGGEGWGLQTSALRELHFATFRKVL